MRKEREGARARNQYTDYIVREPMELMAFLQARMPQASRTKIKGLLSKRLVYVDQQIVTQFNHPLEIGQKVQVSRQKPAAAFHNNLIRLVYEDAYLLVVEKQPGLLSVSSEREKERTAASILTEYLRKSNKRARAYVVHRLDRDTSGLMMFAKDEQTQNRLRDNWHDIVYDRRYIAVLVGEMEKDYGTVESYLTDHKLYVSSSIEDDGGQLAITHYQTIRRGSGLSLVEMRLETGRKNQIRVHMADLGHPVAGDGRYGIEDANPLGRLALHAFKLCFYHPVTGERMQFETPYPASFKRVVSLSNQPRKEDNQEG